MRMFVGLSMALLAMCFFPSTERRANILPVTPNSPFDHYSNICWEDEQARLDSFAITLSNYPTATGQIVVYAGRLACRDEAKYRGTRAKDYVIKRAGLDPRRVEFKDGGFAREVDTYLIVKPKGASDYDVPESLSKDKVSIKRCFDKVFAKVMCLNRR